MIICVRILVSIWENILMANDILDQEFKIKVQLLVLKRSTSAMGLV